MDDLNDDAALRNCYRCGGEFRAGGTERLCFRCRKPKMPKPEILCRQLSLREKQIVELVCQAKLNKEIAYQLHLSEGTIKEYLNRIFRKLGVKNRTGVALWGIHQNSEPKPPATVTVMPVSAISTAGPQRCDRRDIC
jgi:DNA-binding NarL/FixJ family response regulator